MTHTRKIRKTIDASVLATDRSKKETTTQTKKYLFSKLKVLIFDGMRLYANSKSGRGTKKSCENKYGIVNGRNAQTLWSVTGFFSGKQFA